MVDSLHKNTRGISKDVTVLLLFLFFFNVTLVKMIQNQFLETCGIMLVLYMLTPLIDNNLCT